MNKKMNTPIKKIIITVTMIMKKKGGKQTNKKAEQKHRTKSLIISLHR